MQPELITSLKKLKEDIKPRSEWTTLTRDVLLRQINPTQQLGKQSVGLKGLVDLFNQMFRQTVMEPAAVMLVVLGVFLASSLTINAAFYALPGDNLYPVKLTLEKTHVALVANESKKVELKIEFAQKRVAELSKVISQTGDLEDKKKKIETVAKEFKNNVASVNSHLANISKNSETNPVVQDPSQSVNIAFTVTTKTKELLESFNAAVDSLSETEKEELGTIIDVTETAEVLPEVSETETAEPEVVEGEVKGVDNQVPQTSEIVPEEGSLEPSTTAEAVEPSTDEPVEPAE